MDRITYAEIAGKTYPLNFSVKAANEVTERYGGITEINAKLGISAQAGGRKPTETERETLWLLALLLREGAAYQRLMGGELLEPPSEATLAVLLTPMAAMEARASVFLAVSAGLTPTVEAEPDTKNAETTQAT